MKAGLHEKLATRANGVCEACGWEFGTSPALRPEADHFFGRAKSEEAEDTVWLLHGRCHRAKTDSEPSTSFWLRRFLVHAERHGFRAAYDRAFRRLQFVEQRAAFGKGAA